MMSERTRKCLRCPKTEGLTRSHVPGRVIGKWAFGSLAKAYKQGKVQVYFLCEDCRRKHKVLEDRLIRRRMIELAGELTELHRRFCDGTSS